MLHSASMKSCLEEKGFGGFYGNWGIEVFYGDWGIMGKGNYMNNLETGKGIRASWL